MKKSTLVFSSVVAALVLSALLLFRPDAAPTFNPPERLVRDPIQLNQQAVPAQSVDIPPGSTPATHDQTAISPSLQDTDIDGALKTDDEGHLVLNIEVRDFFDYFLSTADEVGPEAAIDEVVRYIQTYLPEPSKSEALELFQNYLRFKRYELTVHQTPITNAVLNDADALRLLRSNIDKLKAHRQTLFSAQQDQALFGLEDVYADHTLSSLAVMADDSLSQSQQRAELERLQNALPPELQSSIEETESERQRQRELAAQLKSNIDDSQLHESLLSQGVEPQKVDEIIAYRQQQQWFEDSYQSYARARAKLDQSGADYGARVEQLQARYFTTPEQQTKAKLRDLKTD